MRKMLYGQLFKAFTLILLAGFYFGQQSMPGVALPAFRSTKPPSPPTELLASSMEDSKIRLTWTFSTSQDVGVYNIYTDNGSGAIDYNTPVATVDHKTNSFTTPPLKSGTSYRFGVRAVSTSDIEEKNTSAMASAAASENISKVTTGSENMQRMKEVTGEVEVSIIADVVIGDLEERRVVKERENIDDISLRLKSKKKRIEDMKKEMKEINSKLLNDRKELDNIRDELSLDREMLMSPDKENLNKKERKKSAGSLAEHTEKLADKEKDIAKMITELINIKSQSESEEIVADAKELIKEAKSRIVQVQAVSKEIGEEKENLEQLKNKVAKIYPELAEDIFSRDMSVSSNTKKPAKTLDEKGAEVKLQETAALADLMVERIEEVRKKITETGAAVINVVKDKELLPEEVKELKEIFINTSDSQLKKLEEIRKKILEEKTVIYNLNAGSKTGSKEAKREELLKSAGKIAELAGSLKEIEKQSAVSYREAAAKKSAFDEKPAADKKNESVVTLGELQKELKDVEVKRSEIIRKRNSLVALEESIEQAREKEKKANEPAVTKGNKTTSPQKKIETDTASFDKKNPVLGIAGVLPSGTALKKEGSNVPALNTDGEITGEKIEVDGRTKETEVQVTGISGVKTDENVKNIKPQEDEEDVIQLDMQGLPESDRPKGKPVNEEKTAGIPSTEVVLLAGKSVKSGMEAKSEDIRDAINKIDKLVEKLDAVGKEVSEKIKEAIKQKEVEAEIVEKKMIEEEAFAGTKAAEAPGVAGVGQIAKNKAPVEPEILMPAVPSGDGTVSIKEHLDSIGTDLDKIFREKQGSIDETTKMAKDISITDIKKEKNVGVDDKATEVAIRLSEGAINFDYNKAEVKVKYYNILNKIAKYLALNPDSKIRVEGHTCYVGSADYNKVLSKKRAEAVVEYFIKHGRLHEGSFSVAGLGKDKPIAPNETEEGRAKNRRVEIVIEK